DREDERPAGRQARADTAEELQVGGVVLRTAAHVLQDAHHDDDVVDRVRRDVVELADEDLDVRQVAGARAGDARPGRHGLERVDDGTRLAQVPRDRTAAGPDLQDARTARQVERTQDVRPRRVHVV